MKYIVLAISVVFSGVAFSQDALQAKVQQYLSEHGSLVGMSLTNEEFEKFRANIDNSQFTTGVNSLALDLDREDVLDIQNSISSAFKAPLVPCGNEGRSVSELDENTRVILNENGIDDEEMVIVEDYCPSSGLESSKELTYSSGKLKANAPTNGQVRYIKHCSGLFCTIYTEVYINGIWLTIAQQTYLNIWPFNILK